MHQLSKRASQNPFRKNGGRVACVAFHPAKPFFFVGAHTLHASPDTTAHACAAPSPCNRRAAPAVCPCTDGDMSA